MISFFLVHRAISVLLHDCTKYVCIGTGDGEANLLVINSNQQTLWGKQSSFFQCHYLQGSGGNNLEKVLMLFGLFGFLNKTTTVITCTVAFLSNAAFYLASLGKIISPFWTALLTLSFPENHHHLVICDGWSQEMALEVPVGAVFSQGTIQAILLGPGECLARESESAARHLEDICTANIHDLTDKGVCGNACQLCSFCPLPC